VSRKLLVRILVFLLVANGIGLAMHYSHRAFRPTDRPAGFARGMLHGALMPLALPSLMMGRDVNIYALENTGRSYKLGYTSGVNACGAIFFGVFFWRVNRWRRARKVGPASAASSRPESS
jgi:hypothetical protein